MFGRPQLEPHLHRRSNRMLAIALLALGAIVGGGIIAYEVLKRPADVHNQEAIEQFKPQKPPPVNVPVSWLPLIAIDPLRLPVALRLLLISTLAEVVLG